MSFTATFKLERLELFANVASHLVLWPPSVLERARSESASALLGLHKGPHHLWRVGCSYRYSSTISIQFGLCQRCQYLDKAAWRSLIVFNTSLIRYHSFGRSHSMSSLPTASHKLDIAREFSCPYSFSYSYDTWDSRIPPCFRQAFPICEVTPVLHAAHE